jgi:hypothetical protein
VTNIVELATATPGTLAWIMVVPGPTGVIGTITLVEFGGIVTVGGTFTTLVSSELRVTVKPPA